MRLQPIKRVVDATISQQRVILHLRCGHNISVTSQQLASEPQISEQLQTATDWPCQYCPDPEPETPEPPEKTVQQLWREAGEP